MESTAWLMTRVGSNKSICFVWWMLERLCESNVHLLCATEENASLNTSTCLYFLSPQHIFSIWSFFPLFLITLVKTLYSGYQTSLLMLTPSLFQFQKFRMRMAAKNPYCVVTTLQHLLKHLRKSTPCWSIYHKHPSPAINSGSPAKCESR